MFLPELLSDMGFNVISKPQIGTRQHGVDVAAIGKNSQGQDAVYLFSIKGGDLTRKEWDGDTNQALRPSLNEILMSILEQTFHMNIRINQSLFAYVLEVKLKNKLDQMSQILLVRIPLIRLVSKNGMVTN